MVNVRRSAARTAEEGIKDYIRTHRLRPGDLLPSESELCEAISCSRSSLREAVCSLSSLDVLEVRHGHGTFVSGLSLEPLLQSMLLRITLNPDQPLEDLRQVIDTRETIDLGGAAELVENHHGADLSEQRELVAQMTVAFAAGDFDGEKYIRFHQWLHSGLRNPLIRELADTFLRVHMGSFDILRLDPPRAGEDTLRAHEEMLDALESGDLDSFRAAVSAHYVPLRQLPR